MVHKRPFGGEDSQEIACKHPRQVEHINRLTSVVEIVPCNDALQKLQTSDGEGEDTSGQSQCGGRVASDSARELLNGSDKEFESSASDSISSFLWVNSSLIDEDAKSEAAAYSSLFPEYFEPDHRVRALVQPDGIYYIPFTDYPPRKPVPVGPDHQAYVPEWGRQNSRNSSESLGKDVFDPHNALSETSGSGLMDDDNNGEKLMGTCILPMPELGPSAYCCCEGGGLLSDCGCLDQGSVRCVSQHIMEARDKLRESLGQKIFEELGFCDMGEEVAKKWSEEEEQSFHDVVMCNPASLGKNFWDHLSVVFPSRTKKELVSYYFNVFMLQKRAEQNRFDPLNIDSDNDEWQRSELESAEDDEESGGESQIEQVAPVYDQEEDKEDCHVDNEDEGHIDACKDDTEVVNHREVAGEEVEGDAGDVAEAQIGYSRGDCGFYSAFQLPDMIPSSNKKGYDRHDDLGKSYEYQCGRVDSFAAVDLGADTRESG